MKKFLLIAIFLIISLKTQVYAAIDDEDHPKVWKLNSISDLGRKSGTCENEGCGKKIRYVYNVKNIETEDLKGVGCVCAARMIEDVSKIFGWEPREWDNSQWTMREISRLTEKPIGKVLAYAFGDNGRFFYNVKGKVGPFDTMNRAKKAAIREYLDGKSD
jgi:hypothetical protein